MSKIYCGVKDVPKGSKRGSMKECAESGKVSYYGIKKIDPKMLALAQSRKKMPSKDALMKKVIPLRVKIKQLKDKYDDEPSKKIAKEYEKKVAEYNKYIRMVKAIDAKNKTQKRSTINISKKGSTKRSSKKRPLKKSSKK